MINHQILWSCILDFSIHFCHWPVNLSIINLSFTLRFLNRWNLFFVFHRVFHLRNCLFHNFYISRSLKWLRKIYFIKNLFWRLFNLFITRILVEITRKFHIHKWLKLHFFFRFWTSSLTWVFSRSGTWATENSGSCILFDLMKLRSFFSKFFHRKWIFPLS